MLFYAPPESEPDADGPPAPLLVSLHTWSTGYDRYDAFDDALAECRRRRWVFVSPHFRGPNNQPEACASDLAVQDVLDAVAYAKRHARVDDRRIYLLGGSGGGHMALVMAHCAPDVWAGVSAWVPITDLATWHTFCATNGYKYATDIEQCLGGPPGEPARDQLYRKRSPIHWLGRAKGLPIDIQAGIHDGHDGASVPLDHSLRAFNALAEANGRRTAALSDEDITFMTREARVPGRLAQERHDEPARKHRVLFRRTAGLVRLTVFDGGHAIDVVPALNWLSEQRKAPE